MLTKKRSHFILQTAPQLLPRKRHLSQLSKRSRSCDVKSSAHEKISSGFLARQKERSPLAGWNFFFSSFSCLCFRSTTYYTVSNSLKYWAVKQKPNPQKQPSGSAPVLQFYDWKQRDLQRKVRWGWWVLEKLEMEKWVCLVLHWEPRTNTRGWILSSQMKMKVLHSTSYKKKGAKKPGNMSLLVPFLLLSTLFFSAMVHAFLYYFSVFKVLIM